MISRDFDETLATILLRLKKNSGQNSKMYRNIRILLQKLFKPIVYLRQSEGEDNLLGSYVYLVNTLSIIFSFLAWEVSYRI